MSESRSASLNFTWPNDEDGNPMALITMQLSELIGLPNYSNITVGPGSVTRFVKDDDEEVANGLAKCALQVENILAAEREPVIQMIEGR